MHDVRQDRYPTVIREMIPHENNVTNHHVVAGITLSLLLD